jgi:hypothetical protein
MLRYKILNVRDQRIEIGLAAMRQPIQAVRHDNEVLKHVGAKRHSRINQSRINQNRGHFSSGGEIKDMV